MLQNYIYGPIRPGGKNIYSMSLFFRKAKLGLGNEDVKFYILENKIERNLEKIASSSPCQGAPSQNGLKVRVSDEK